MPQDVSDQQVQEALQTCADEPVHIPGFIQPFGALLAYPVQTGEVSYASENLSDILGRSLNEIFGEHIRDLVGRELWHAIQNHASVSVDTDRLCTIGVWSPADEDRTYIVSAWKNAGYVILEFEIQTTESLLSIQQLQEQNQLIDRAQKSQNIQELLDLSTRQLRHLTGFDRVMVYRFDQDWNGEVIAESRASSLDPFLGLNFPSFDIPAQARAIMARIPLRLIADIDQINIPLKAASEDLPPLDISLCETRGTSDVHMQYLRNMGINATMTLSIVVDDILWGIISFHHRRPRLVAAQIRIVLKGFLDVFCLKLGLLQEKRIKYLSESVDDLQNDIQTLINVEPDLGALLEGMGGKLCEAFDAVALHIRSEKKQYSFGDIPVAQVLDAVVASIPASETAPYFTDSLLDVMPEMANALGTVAGVAAIRHSNDWVLLIFRENITRKVSWAGDPQKTVEIADGNARLHPRGSFSTFLAETRGKSKAWTGEDQMLAKKLWPLLSAALNSEQKRRYTIDLNRQQELMIDELNHRVRNILSLVQAVSTEAKKSESSLESYSMAIEARIRALAAAHSIGSTTSAKHVQVSDIILQEAQPYEIDGKSRIRIRGVRRLIAAELAPIFALTIHELMTNAAKYGALSISTGFIDVFLDPVSGGLDITWRERNGPIVAEPKRQGFGTTLIKRAVPYELGGKSELKFPPKGVEVTIFLPSDILTDEDPQPGVEFNQPNFSDHESFSGPVIPDHLKRQIALIVEDNFMIAEGVAQQLEDIGFEHVETASSVESAMEFLAEQSPGFAILDVNLGQGKTSLPIAEVLMDRKVPMIFATGYGELSSMPPRLSKLIALTKPIDILELSRAIARTTNN